MSYTKNKIFFENCLDAKEYLKEKQIKTLCFDLDGTLIDSEKGILASLQEAFKLADKNPPTSAFLKEINGQPLREMIQMGLDQYLDSRSSLKDPLLVEKIVKNYRDYYDIHGLKDCTVFNGIEEILKRQKDQGLVSYVVTAKADYVAKRVVQHYGLTRFFKDIYAPAPSGEYSIKAELLKYVIEKENLNPTTTVMIGDTRADMNAGKANGVFTVGVLYGIGSRASLVDNGANCLCKDVSELAEIICP